MGGFSKLATVGWIVSKGGNCWMDFDSEYFSMDVCMYACMYVLELELELFFY